MKNNRNKNFFLWLHFFAPHTSYAPPPQYYPSKKPPAGMNYKISTSMMEKAIRGEGFLTAEEKEWAKELYRGEVKYDDDNIGEFIDALKEIGLYDNSLIIFTSDHGEEFWDHASEGRGVMHGHSLYGELIDIPLIIKKPGSKKGRIENALVTTEGLMPTILDLCKVSYDKEHISADSFARLLNDNPSDFIEKAVYSTGIFQAGEEGHPEDMESITFGNYKYIAALKNRKEKVFHIKDDPLELFPVKDIPESLREKINKTLAYRHSKDKELKKYFGITGGKSVFLDKSSVNELKTLGYF